MNTSVKEILSENINTCSNPSELKITDIRVANIDGAPKHCPLIKIYTNQGIVGYGEVKDASSATYALMLKSRLIGENPCNVDNLFRRIKQFGGPSRQGGGVSGLEIALWDLTGKAWGVPLWQMLGGKFRDKARVYGDTDVDGKHTGTDMGKAIKKRIDMGFTIVKMDLGIELLYDEPGCLNAPLGMLENMDFEEAAKLTKIINPKVGIPTHYEMFESNTEDPAKYTSIVNCGFEMDYNKEYDVLEILKNA